MERMKDLGVCHCLLASSAPISNLIEINPKMNIQLKFNALKGHDITTQGKFLGR